MQQQAVTNISSAKVVGSGRVAFALPAEPLPKVWPKWVRHVLYPAGVLSVLRHTT
jgi:hypothetical protein